MTQLEKAIELAVHAHAAQMDEDGMPHIVHCMEVMLKVKAELEGKYDIALKALKKYTEEELLIAAILHDTVEDSSIPLKHIEVAFGANVAHIVDCLTRRGLGKGETKEFYRDFIYRADADPGASLIKWCDLCHNMSRTHKIAASKAKWRAKLEYKYHVAMMTISNGTTWEQASWSATWNEVNGVNTPSYFIADPNGKKMQITEEEFNKLKDAKRP
jgi:GTP diphosphokinase / guanosine-3',5'-bis(diphosphate) 3'-diphosphatase